MLTWLRRRDRRVYKLVLYGRALRRRQIRKNLLPALRRNAFSAISDSLRNFVTGVKERLLPPRVEQGAREDSADEINSLVLEKVANTPSSREGKNTAGRVPTLNAKSAKVKEQLLQPLRGERVEQETRKDAAKKSGRLVLEVAKTRLPAEVGDAAAREGKATAGQVSPVGKTRLFAEVGDAAAREGIATAGQVSPAGKGMASGSRALERVTKTKTSTATTEDDEFTTPIIPSEDGPSEDYKSAQEKLRERKITVQEMKNVLKTVYQRVPPQLQEKLTGAFGIRKLGTVKQPSRIPEAASSNLSFLPYIETMDRGDKEVLVRVLQLKFGINASAIEQNYKFGSMRPWTASLERDILPDVEVSQSSQSRSIGWRSYALGNFTGKVVTSYNQEALTYALEEIWLRGEVPGRHVYYVDAAVSKLRHFNTKGCRLGIAFPRRISSGAAINDMWRAVQVKLLGRLTSWEAELAGIVYMLKLIRDNVQAEGRGQINKTAVIFTDGLHGLTELSGLSFLTISLYGLRQRQRPLR